MNTQTNVLIIEDESIIAKDFAFMVEQLGLCVIGAATTCAEAIALAKLAPIGLILSDVMLSDGSSGITAVEQILEERDAAVVFVTASPQLLPPSFRESAFVVEKPYREAAVLAAIEQAVSRRCDCPKLLPCACAPPQHPS